MNLQTFKAPTMAAALAQVKTAMGHDALILHTRTYQQRFWLGLRRQEIVEITAGRVARRRPAPQMQQPAMLSPQSQAPRLMAAASATTTQPAALSFSRSAAAVLETPAANTAV